MNALDLPWNEKLGKQSPDDSQPLRHKIQRSSLNRVGRFYFHQSYLFMHYLDKIKILSLLTLLCFASIVNAQVTTATIVGSVKAPDGEGLPGASVLATHMPSGTKYGTTTSTDGRFTLPNMRVGGPYKVQFSMTGFEAQSSEGIMLALGQKMVINQDLRENTATLQWWWPDPEQPPYRCCK